MSPTRIRLLLAITVIAGALGWGAVSLIEGQSGRVIPVPWLAAATLWLLAIALGFWGILSRPRLQRHPGARPMPPLVAARTAALAMAASRTGALVLGIYTGIGAGAFAVRITLAGQNTLWASIGTALGALLLVCAGLWVEHLCRLPTPGSDSEGPGGRIGSPT